MAEFDSLVKQQRALTVKDELDRIYKQAGARGMNANTTSDRTFFHIELPSNKVELWAWLESDRLKNAVFREFYSERDVVIEERRLRVDATPTGKAGEAFTAMVWQAHPYSWPVIGWISDVTQMTRDQANEFFATYYAPNNITAVLVGDFNPGEVLQMLERYFGRIPANPKNPPKVITQEPVQTAEQRLNAEVESNPSTIIAFKTVPSVHRDAAALEVLGSLLNGKSGRLYKELVLNQKSAVGVGAFYHGMKYGGTFSLYAMSAPDRRPEDLEPMLYAEIEKIAREGLTEHELQGVKNRVRAESFSRMEGHAALRDALAEAEGRGTYKDFLDEPDRLTVVTNEDVKRVANVYFKKERSNVMTIHRKAKEHEVK
ncbi:hypothetical protein GETHLI_19540 [Geothrix limicola]|uniref:Peptidase M16 C-terminal domain-containing protein n=2 Tax=Geothrix limicola TaxID=2927978 RepID=A0ABQ5QFM1_9BACT|nr:hypothetical protein GETHLI_19540 [Geothrix limicola]